MNHEQLYEQIKVYKIVSDGKDVNVTLTVDYNIYRTYLLYESFEAAFFVLPNGFFRHSNKLHEGTAKKIKFPFQVCDDACLWK